MVISIQWWAVEAIHRANLQADSRGVITAKDIQRILPELFLDFWDISLYDVFVVNHSGSSIAANWHTRQLSEITVLSILSSWTQKRGIIYSKLMDIAVGDLSQLTDSSMRRGKDESDYPVICGYFSLMR